MGRFTAKAATRSVLGAGILTLLGSVHAPLSIGDDTEIYSTTVAASGSARPKVLIVMDTSGSMNITAVEASDTKPSYDPNETYVDAGFDNDKIYWMQGNTTDKPAIGSNNWFYASKNRCATSYGPLEFVGFAKDKFRRLAFNNNGKAKWRKINANDKNPIHVDCAADISQNNAGNGPGVADGFPINPVNPRGNPPVAYTPSKGGGYSSPITRNGDIHSFYTGHYLNYWYDDTLLQVSKTRLEVAQEVITDLINANQSIDFGLAVFNHNSHGSFMGWQCNPYYCTPVYNTADDHGGRVVAAVLEDMTPAQRTDLAGPAGVINSLTATGSTPLCETTYEAFRYISGQAPLYGLKQDTDTWDFNAGHDGVLDAPDDDPRALVSATEYKRPTTDCAYTYVILMTDGFPSLDTDANSRIESLTGRTCGNYALDGGGSGKNCLAEITRYMANNDLDNDDTNGNQYGITYTIGFATDQVLLEEAAENGGGNYYTADDTEELARAFDDALLEILADETSFTSPSVAVNTFTRTESRNEVFFAMFQPDGTKDWRGNVKRLDIDYIEDNDAPSGYIKKFVDSDGHEAINPLTDFIKDEARTLWLPEASEDDGPLVDQGGVGELLAARDLSDRDIYTNTGANGAFQPFATASFTPEAYGFDVSDPSDPDQALLDFWGVDDADELDDSVQWGRGYDTQDLNEDGDTTDNREWILGDILHSRPRVISYGLINSRTEGGLGADLRVLVGTNAGFLHMFGNDDGEEDWAFFPKELAPVLTLRRLDSADVARPYGVDSQPVVYTYDDNQDGTFDHTDGDKVWAFFGLRRGGRYMYAIDISDPDNPSFMWSIGPETPGFEEIGQTWSVPEVTYVPGHKDLQQKPKPVLVFGAGYDPLKDDHDSLGDDGDTMGRGVFIVDAATGSLVWSVTPGGDTATNMQATELANSVPAPVATMDSNGDGLSDRIYFGDTAGIVWRVDMAGASLPTSSQDTWFLTKLFTAVPEGTARTQANDRRFFNKPNVVQIVKDEKPVDAVLMGSGDRTNPAARDNSNQPLTPAVDNEFYMILDRAVLPITSALPPITDCTSLPADSINRYRCELPIDPSELYDATEDIFSTGTDNEKLTARAALEGKGWRITLQQEGEKSLSNSITVAGIVLFTTFTPGVADTSSIVDVCSPVAGTGRLYAVNLFDASESNLPDFDNRYKEIGNQIPDAPAIHVDRDGNITIIPPQGGGGTGDSNLIDPGVELPPPYGTFWYREEY